MSFRFLHCKPTPVFHLAESLFIKRNQYYLERKKTRTAEGSKSDGEAKMCLVSEKKKKEESAFYRNTNELFILFKSPLIGKDPDAGKD